MILIASLLVYIWGYYVCLICYREFKALMKEGYVNGGMGVNMMGGGAAGGNNAGGRQYQREDSDDEEER